MRPTVTEIRALVPLLKQDWESPEKLAEALIQALDKARVDRKLFSAVAQYGSNGNVFYAGVGPIAGLKTARNVLDKMLYKSLVSKGAVVPLKTLEGFEAHMAQVDAPATHKQD